MIRINDIDIELAQRAAQIIIGNYAHPVNLKHWGFCKPDPESKRGKKWVTVPQGYVSNKALTENIHKRTNKVYGIAHKTFTNCLILDVDDPTRQDAWMLMDFLDFQGIKYKAFDSGKGIHIWTLWDKLPPDLMCLYGGPHKVFDALGKWLLEMLEDDISTDKVDLRGCNHQKIKLPGQWEPVYEKYMLPYDHNRELITDYREVVEFMMRIELNDPARVKDLLYEGTVNKTFDGTYKHQQSGDGSANQGGFLDREKYLTQVTVGPGESNDFIHGLVRGCCRAKMSEDEVLDFVKQVYKQGKDDERVTCKDSESDWLSKARGRFKFYQGLPQLDIQVSVNFYHSDFQWLAQNIQVPNDDRFLSCHLWAFRKSGDGQYYLSYEKIRELCRMGHKATSQRIKRFIRDGVIRKVEDGKAKPPSSGRRRATVYELLTPPALKEGLLEEHKLMDFIRAFREHRRTAPQDTPSFGGNKEAKKGQQGKEGKERNTLNADNPLSPRRLPPELLSGPSAFDDPALLENLQRVTMKILKQHDLDPAPSHPRHPAPDNAESIKGSQRKGASRRINIGKAT